MSRAARSAYVGRLAKLVRKIEAPTALRVSQYPLEVPDVPRPFVYPVPGDLAASLMQDLRLSAEQAQSYCNNPDNSGRLRRIDARGKAVYVYGYGGVHGRLDVDNRILLCDRAPEVLITELKSRVHEEAEREAERAKLHRGVQ